MYDYLTATATVKSIIVSAIEYSHPNLRFTYHTLEIGTLGHYSRTTRDAVQVVYPT